MSELLEFLGTPIDRTQPTMTMMQYMGLNDEDTLAGVGWKGVRCWHEPIEDEL